MVIVSSLSEISVQWSTVGSPCRAKNGNITSYRIQYKIQPNGMVQTVQSEGRLRKITLTGLTPFTNYSIEVAAVNEEGDVGVYSEPQYAVTYEDSKLVASYSKPDTLSLTHTVIHTHSLTHSLSLSLVPGPVSDIASVPSFFTITITWEEPEMPNGIITKYEVVYGPTGSPQFTITEDNITTVTTFTTPDDLERGTDYTFTVTAHTSVGPGEPTTVNILTLDRPGKSNDLYRCTIMSNGLYR